jgi:hypothetical protein
MWTQTKFGFDFILLVYKRAAFTYVKLNIAFKLCFVINYGYAILNRLRLPQLWK